MSAITKELGLVNDSRGESHALRVSAVVATIGKSRWLAPCLEALRREGGTQLEIILVDQTPEPCSTPAGLVDLVLRPGRNLGFAQANNLAFAAAHGELLVTVNDDALIEPGWLQGLLAELERQPRAAAVQGVNLRLDEPSLADGCGLGWNGAWQAIQLGRDHPPPTTESASEEIFGVSATAAIYRREALYAVSGEDLEAFDPALGSYWEDVDLAARLRTAGWHARLVPAARAHHAGSTSGEQIGLGSTPWIYGNRHLVLARMLGLGYWARWPKILGRDLIDLGQALLDRRGRLAVGILRGWLRALPRFPRFAHFGPARLQVEELRRFMVRPPPADRHKH